MAGSPSPNAKSVPEWAKRRAIELSHDCGGFLYDIQDERLFGEYPDGGFRNQSLVAFARYIAEHEDEPVDPFEQAFADAFSETRIDEIGGWIMPYRKLRALMDERGIELAGEQK